MRHRATPTRRRRRTSARAWLAAIAAAVATWVAVTWFSVALVLIGR